MHAPPTDDPGLGLTQVIGQDGAVRPGGNPKLPASTLRSMYREMVRIRMVDERMLSRQRQGKVGFYGAITGQEATPIATAFALDPGDWVFPALRESVIMLVRGFPLRRWLAQVYGNRLDLLKGRQMPSHMSGRAVHQVSWSSCIGSQIPQAVGAAWAARMKAKRTVTVGFLGDGATSEPDFHAGMNFAAVYHVPCVLICQNNHWSISVPSSRQTASPTIAIKAHAYGMAAARVDGNDILAVYSVVNAAVDRARRGDGPTFIEAVTYRVGPHSSSDDPSLYRSEEEVAVWRERDPIDRFERYLRRRGIVTDADKQTLLETLDAEIRDAITEVEDEPPPPRETLFDDVYQQLPWHLREQRQRLHTTGGDK